MTKQAVRERRVNRASQDVREPAKAEPPVGGVDDHAMSQQTGGMQLVTFQLRDEEFGFDIMSVQEIIRLPKMARLPNTAEYVEGVSNLRGALLPIIDIRSRFGMKREDRTERSRVLVLDVDGRRTGLLVDGVRQVTRVGHHEFERPPAAIRNGMTDFVNGVVKLDQGERIIISLDARRICQPEHSEDDAKSSVRNDESAGPAKETKANESGAEALILPQSGSDTAKHSIGGDMHQIVSFQLGREEFAFPMQDVREILRVQTPKGVPGAPDHVLGVLTVRGQILPIVDLRRLLKLDSFAAEHIDASSKAAALYTDVLNQGGPDDQRGAGRRIETHGALLASERLRAWLTVFNSSSQTLMETIAQLRGWNEQIAKWASVESPAAGSPQRHEEIATGVRTVVNILEIFQQQVHSHIREDQRIIVVESDGFQLGLVVDHVNEVLGLREDAIEAPPDLGQHDGARLSGIAKLDDGNRLILLMDTGGLLSGKSLADIKHRLDEKLNVLTDEMKSETEAGAAEYELQLVTFLLGQEEYGIPIATIQEIDRLSKITQTPKAPRFVEGVTNLRGEVIPVLSTRALFGLESRIADDRTRVIIVDLGGTKTGLVVDSVKEVMSMSSRNIAPPPASISSSGDGHFISGIGKVDEGRRMIVLLDMAKILTRSEHGELVAAGRTV